jgi:hypothetical protein
MIQFNYSGDPYPSFEDMQASKKFFLEKLGPFKDEFEQKHGIVTFNYSYPDTDKRRIAFVLGENYDLSDFTIRWNEYILSHKDDPV